MKQTSKFPYPKSREEERAREFFDGTNDTFPFY